MFLIRLLNGFFDDCYCFSFFFCWLNDCELNNKNKNIVDIIAVLKYIQINNNHNLYLQCIFKQVKFHFLFLFFGLCLALWLIGDGSGHSTTILMLHLINLFYVFHLNGWLVQRARFCDFNQKHIMWNESAVYNGYFSVAHRYSKLFFYSASVWSENVRRENIDY